MGKLYRSAKGIMVDMEALLLQQENTIAVGNISTNARGDIIGRGGKIIKGRDEVVQEYYRGNPNAIQQVSIKDELPQDFFETPSQAMSRLNSQSQQNQTEQDTPKKRKIIETDN
jgi:hypothetical protein